MRRTLILIILLTAAFSAARAQRTSTESILVSVEGSAAISGTPGSGIQVTGGKYLLDAYVKGGLGLWKYRPAQPDAQKDYMDVALTCEYMYRLFGSYSRMLNLYAGGGAFLGYTDKGANYHPEELEASEGEESSSVSAVRRNTFLSGVAASLEAEFFLTRSMALVGSLNGIIPITGDSTQRWIDLTTINFHLMPSFGLRYNF